MVEAAVKSEYKSTGYNYLRQQSIPIQLDCIIIIIIINPVIYITKNPNPNLTIIQDFIKLNLKITV